MPILDGALTTNELTVNSVNDICALPVQAICEDDCILFMWWVASMPREALDVVDAWGFTLKTMTGFTWVKKTKHWKNHFGMGFWTRAGSENCLIAAKGNIKRVSAGVRSVVEERVGKHSEKPDVFRTRIVELIGDLPRIELFSRKAVPGWDGWGDDYETNL